MRPEALGNLINFNYKPQSILLETSDDNAITRPRKSTDQVQSCVVNDSRHAFTAIYSEAGAISVLQNGD
jgi:hypothetical protein